ALESPRAVQLDFTSPVNGTFQVMLDIVPTAPLPAEIALPLPSPRGTQIPGGGFAAYRTHGVVAERASLLRVTGVQARDFAPFWNTDSRPDPLSLAYACAI